MTIEELAARITALEARINVPQKMTIKEAAHYMGIHYTTMQKRMVEIPHEKRNRKVLFNKCDLDKWSQKHTKNK